MRTRPANHNKKQRLLESRRRGGTGDFSCGLVNSFKLFARGGKTPLTTFLPIVRSGGGDGADAAPPRQYQYRLQAPLFPLIGNALLRDGGVVKAEDAPEPLLWMPPPTPLFRRRRRTRRRPSRRLCWIG